MKNLINCGTCGYPLTPEERTTLVEKDGVMVKPAPVQPVDFEAIIDDIEAIDCRYRGDPSYDRDAYWMRDEVVATVKRHASFYTAPPAAQRQWVGLTTAEFDEIHENSDTLQDAMLGTIAKLKEKNT